MKKITHEEVKNTSKLANLPLSPKEEEIFSKQLSEVIDFNISHLEKIDTNGIEPTAHVGDIKDRHDEDEPEPGFSVEEALQNAKETHNGFFKVKAILEN